MTVNDIEGSALARVENPQAVGRLPLRRELNGSYRELVQAIRDADSDIADGIYTFDLTEGQNTYPTPPDVDTIRNVTRFDFWGDVDVPQGATIHPVPLDMLERAQRPAYALAPTGIVFWPTPARDFVGGVRMLTLPTAEPLIMDDQVPRIPLPMHDPLVAHLTRRLGSMAGIQLAQGAADFIASQERFLLTYLNPGGREQITRFARTKGTYHPRRF